MKSIRTNDDPFLSKRELAKYLGTSTATVDRMRSEGTAPPATMVTPGRLFWRTSLVDKWLGSRTEAASTP